MSEIICALSLWLQQQPQPCSVLVAYSGGRDSHVLLDALHHLRQTHPIALRAIHINHGLQTQSTSWAQHCQKICEHYAVPLQIVCLQLTIPHGESLEAVAREARYAAFMAALQPNEYVLTAHTIDDQAETLLLQLMRGSGPKGLSGIASTKTLGKGRLVRPLLDVSRQAIVQYAQEKQLQWVEDHSNTNLRFRRNALRQTVFPQLEQITPGSTACFARSAKHCAELQATLEEYIAADFHACVGNAANTLQLSVLKQYSLPRQQAILRYWFNAQQASLPSTKVLNAILRQMLTAKEDTQPCVSWSTLKLQRFKDLLYLLPKVVSREAQTLSWDISQPLQLQDGSIWQASLKTGKGIDVKRFSQAILQVKFRRGGEICQPSGVKMSRTLKKILQENHIPPWQRAIFPLFYLDDQLIAAGDIFVSAGWEVTAADQPGWVIYRK